MKEGISKIYSYRKNFLIIGLTGRTGSGCTTSTDFLRKKKNEIEFEKLNDFEVVNNEDRKKKIILHYAKSNWESFYSIRAKDIITAFILENPYNEFVDYLITNFSREEESETIKMSFNSIKSEYSEMHELRKTLQKKENEISLEVQQEKINEKYNFHFDKLPKFTDTLKNELERFLGNNFTSIFQKIGNNIRSTGNAIDDTSPSIEKSDYIVAKMNKLIKLLRKKSELERSSCLVVLDALRNPFEIYFLRERYNSFYLFSINTEDESRRNRLKNLNLEEKEIDALDGKEYPKKLFGHNLYISQDIQKCIEISDIHINNPDISNQNLYYQLLLYCTLILKPGIVTPTSSERVMQLAYSAKANSGCISRQVGAAITDKNFSIKAIGWNNTPQYQTPCLLRNSDNLFNNRDNESFSKYEKENKEFLEIAKLSLTTKEIAEFHTCGNNISYCFKDIQNSLEGEKNQVHTRSLHAEENAFLQLSKYGNSSIESGILFTTASPCELCSKKAYQLGIREIYYIDPYPGIATPHILNGGTNNPKLILFSGAIGSAYFKLYNPLLSYKDEIKQVTDLNYQKKDTSEIVKLKAQISILKAELDSLKKRE